MSIHFEPECHSGTCTMSVISALTDNTKDSAWQILTWQSFNSGSNTRTVQPVIIPAINSRLRLARDQSWTQTRPEFVGGGEICWAGTTTFRNTSGASPKPGRWDHQNDWPNGPRREISMPDNGSRHCSIPAVSTNPACSRCPASPTWPTGVRRTAWSMATGALTGGKSLSAPRTSRRWVPPARSTMVANP